MSEISVSIRGRDDGLGQHLDTLRQKANALGLEVSNLNKMSSMTPTEQRVSVNKIGENTLREQQNRIKSDYQEIRRSQYSDYKETEESYNSGKISKKQFEEYEQKFFSEQGLTNKAETKELADAEREMSRLLRIIAKEMVDKRKLDAERAQRDKKEFDGSSGSGLISGLLSEQKDLRLRRANSSDPEEIAMLNEELENNKKKLREFDSNSSSGEVNMNQISSAASSVGSGDLVGTAMSAPQAMRGMGMSGGAAAGAAAAAGIIYALWSWISSGDDLTESLGPVSSLRGNGMSAAAQNRYYKENMDINGMAGNLGLSGEQLSEAMYQKAIGSGVGGNLSKRAMDQIAFQKGFGGDSSILDQFQRFNKNQEDSTKISLDVLNVLTSIQRSSLKEGDLVTLNEKLKSQSSIMGIQRQKRDLVDQDSSLRILAAFESIGLSGKGEKGADFLSSTIEGLSEGGSDNVMMLKLEAAKRSRPDLANNPAALRRLVKFNPDSPEYISQAFKLLSEISGGDQMAMDDLLYTFFNPQSEMDMNMYKEAMSSGDFSNLLKGKGVNKTRKQSLSEDAMYSEAQSSVGMTTQMMNDFKQTVRELSPSEFFKTLIFGSGGDSLRVTVVGDQTKKGNQTPIKTNSTTGK